MAPQRFRGVPDDSRSESSSTREKQNGGIQSGISKVRRYAAATAAASSSLKDVTLAPASATIQQNGQDGPSLMEKVSDPNGTLKLTIADFAFRRSNGHPLRCRS